MKNILYISALIILFHSCTSNDAAQRFEQVEEADVLIKREVLTKTNGEVTSADFTYNGNKLTSSVSSEGHTINYSYNNDLLSGLNIIENGAIIITVDLEYDSNQLVSYTANFAGSLVERFDFTYNSATSILVKRYSGDGSNQTFEDDINVNLQDGNISSVTFPDYSLQYQYDAQNCIYKNIFAIDILNFVGLDFGGFEGILNNPTLRNEVDAGEAETETFNHTYNTFGFPASTEVLLNGEPYGTIEYYYE